MKETSESRIIEITARLCAKGVQKDIYVGRKFVVDEVTKLKDGTPVLVVKNSKVGRGVSRINARRFRWRIVPVAEIAAAKRKQMIQMDGRAKKELLNRSFSDDEIDKVLFTPYIYELLAWHYVGEAKQYAADNKLDYKKESRMAVQMREEAAEDAAKELGRPVLNHFLDGIEQMVQIMNKELMRIWWAVNGEIKRVHPDTNDINLKTYAMVGLLAADLLDEHETNSDNLIKKKFKGLMVYEHKGKRSRELHKVLIAYAGDAIDVDRKRLELSVSVLRNNIEAIPFTTLREEFRSI